MEKILIGLYNKLLIPDIQNAETISSEIEYIYEEIECPLYLVNILRFSNDPSIKSFAAFGLEKVIKKRKTEDFIVTMVDDFLNLALSLNDSIALSSLHNVLFIICEEHVFIVNDIIDHIIYLWDSGISFSKVFSILVRISPLISSENSNKIVSLIENRIADYTQLSDEELVFIIHSISKTEGSGINEEFFRMFLYQIESRILFFEEYLLISILSSLNIILSKDSLIDLHRVVIGFVYRYIDCTDLLSNKQKALSVFEGYVSKDGCMITIGDIIEIFLNLCSEITNDDLTCDFSAIPIDFSIIEETLANKDHNEVIFLFDSLLDSYPNNVTFQCFLILVGVINEIDYYIRSRAKQVFDKIVHFYMGCGLLSEIIITKFVEFLNEEAIEIIDCDINCVIDFSINKHDYKTLTVILKSLSCFEIEINEIESILDYIIHLEIFIIDDLQILIYCMNLIFQYLPPYRDHSLENIFLYIDKYFFKGDNSYDHASNEQLLGLLISLLNFSYHKVVEMIVLPNRKWLLNSQFSLFSMLSFILSLACVKCDSITNLIESLLNLIGIKFDVRLMEFKEDDCTLCLIKIIKTLYKNYRSMVDHHNDFIIDFLLALSQSSSILVKELSIKAYVYICSLTQNINRIYEPIIENKNPEPHTYIVLVSEIMKKKMSIESSFLKEVVLISIQELEKGEDYPYLLLDSIIKNDPDVLDCSLVFSLIDSDHTTITCVNGYIGLLAEIILRKYFSFSQQYLERLLDLCMNTFSILQMSELPHSLYCIRSLLTKGYFMNNIDKLLFVFEIVEHILIIDNNGQDYFSLTKSTAILLLFEMSIRFEMFVNQKIIDLSISQFPSFMFRVTGSSIMNAFLELFQNGSVSFDVFIVSFLRVFGCNSIKWKRIHINNECKANYLSLFKVSFLHQIDLWLKDNLIYTKLMAISLVRIGKII